MDIASIKEEDMTNLTSQGYTAADISMLGETEVKALLQPERTGYAEDDPHEADAADQDAAAAAAAAASATPAAAAEDPPADPVATLPADPVGLAVQFTADVPADAEDQLKALKTEEREAFKRLMDGEIDSDDYQAVRDRVEGEVDTLKTKMMQASIFQQANTQAAEQAAKNEWTRAETAAFDGFKAEGLDYKAKPALLAAYNTNLKALGADPKNERRDASWFLTEAHRLTKEDLGVVTKPKIPVVPGKEKVDFANLPPTLRSVPVAATGAIASDEFAHMRNLTGTALEKAHAALTEAQRDRYMAE